MKEVRRDIVSRIINPFDPRDTGSRRVCLWEFRVKLKSIFFFDGGVPNHLVEVVLVGRVSS